MKTGLMEKHVRRIVCRWENQKQNWKTFAFVAVLFGDRPTANPLHICTNLCLEIFKDIDTVAAERVKEAVEHTHEGEEGAGGAEGAGEGDEEEKRRIGGGGATNYDLYKYYNCIRLIVAYNKPLVS